MQPVPVTRRAAAAALLCLLGLGACSDPLVRQARREVTARIAADGREVRFHEVMKVSDQVVCGEVNAFRAPSGETELRHFAFRREADGSTRVLIENEDGKLVDPLAPDQPGFRVTFWCSPEASGAPAAGR